MEEKVDDRGRWKVSKDQVCDDSGRCLGVGPRSLPGMLPAYLRSRHPSLRASDVSVHLSSLVERYQTDCPKQVILVIQVLPGYDGVLHNDQFTSTFFLW